jgi:hypothetical protein
MCSHNRHEADIVRIKIHGPRSRSSGGNRHAPFPLDVVLPLVRVGMPMNLPQSTGFQRYLRGAQLLGHRKLINIDDLDTASGPHRIRPLLTKFLQGHSSAAVKFFLRATDLDPSDSRPYLFLTEAFQTTQGKDAQVLASLKHYSEQFPTRAEASYLYAVALSQEGAGGGSADAQVESLLKQAIALSPGFAKAHFQLGTLYAHRKDYESAIREFEITEHLATGMKEVHYRLASAYRRAGQAEAAEREMKLFRESHEPNTEDGGSGISIEQFISVVDRPHSAPKDVMCFQSADK